jgi:hypothetical protein
VYLVENHWMLEQKKGRNQRDEQKKKNVDAIAEKVRLASLFWVCSFKVNALSKPC